MRAINHALSGAIIGFVISEPLIALPAAFASHFVLDAIPHHGLDEEDIRAKWFKDSLLVDAGLCLILVMLLVIWHPQNWLLAALCAFLAAAPDFMWLPRYLRAQRGQKQVKPGAVLRFHSWIQWFQRPIGAVVEVAWFGAMSWIIFNLIS